MAEGMESGFQIYNTMTKKKEKFVPLVPGKVAMYVCGVTSYDFSHIGHARAYVAFDVLFRYLKYLGYEVKYVRNFTDVDDKTPSILNNSLQEALRLMNQILTMLKEKVENPQKLSNIESLVELEIEVRGVLDVLGLLSTSTYTEVLKQLREKAMIRAELTEEDILNRIKKHALARKNEDFFLSYQIRDDLTLKGIALMDVGEDMIWRLCVPAGEKKLPDYWTRLVAEFTEEEILNHRERALARRNKYLFPGDQIALMDVGVEMVPCPCVPACGKMLPNVWSRNDI